jgi:protein involved in polysaccharide export with SLBB domain
MAGVRIRVIVSGAVRSGGPLELSAGATVETALRAAGGLAYRPHARPEGQLVVRRRAPTQRRVEVHRWNIHEDERERWASFRLEHHDVLVFGWSLDAAP